MILVDIWRAERATLILTPFLPADGGSNKPGFDPNDPDAGAYHYMYVANGVPLPSSLLLGVVGIVGVVVLQCRRCRR